MLKTGAPAGRSLSLICAVWPCATWLWVKLSHRAPECDVLSGHGKTSTHLEHEVGNHLQGQQAQVYYQSDIGAVATHSAAQAQRSTSTIHKIAYFCVQGQSQAGWHGIEAHPVEGGALIVQLLARFAHALLPCSAVAHSCAFKVRDVGVALYMHPLTCAQSPKVLCCLGDRVPIQAKRDFASALPIYVNVKEHLEKSQKD